MSDLLTKSQKRDLAKRVDLDQYIKSDIDLDNRFFEYDLGVIIYTSQHIEHRAPIASRCFESAASHGSGEAHFRLGQMYESGDGTQMSIQNAYSHYIEAAICGDKHAADYIKKSYKTNTDIQDYFKKLFESYSKREPNEDDYQVIGFLYHHGYGARKNQYKAIRCYEKAAEKGLKNAQRNLGILYQKSRTKQNKFEIGFLFLLNAAYQDDPIAQYLVGLSYEFGHGIDQDREKAFTWFEMSANNRNKDAGFSLAKFYRLGKAVPRDDEKAIRWYEDASLQKYTVAKVCIGQLYQNRSNSSQDQDMAKQYYIESSKIGCVTAQLRLDVLNSEKYNDTKTFKELAKKALIGDPESQEKIGLQYKNGSDFVDKNTDIAFKWYLRAALSGKIESQYNVGQMYYLGQLTKKSLRKAVKWIMKAAKHGHCKAQCDLGQLYQKGEGVKKNAWQAIKWYTFAMYKGNDDAQYYLGRMYEEGEGVPKKISSAKDHYQKAAQKGNDKAQYRLGYLYELEKKYRKAFKYYKMAAEKKNIDAQVGLGTLYKNGQGVETDYGIAIEFYLKAVDHSCNAKYQLACIYVDQESRHVNYLKAYSLFKSAWKMGYKEAFWIASDESYSPDIEPKVQDIVKMYNAAAENENDEAEYKLGLLFEQAVLVKQDYEKALIYYRKSSKRGNSNALTRIASLYERGKGITKNYEKSIEYYNRAISSNNVEACFCLAVFYCNGDNIDPDYPRAFELFSKAFEKGHIGAKQIFETLEPEYYTGSSNNKWALNMFEFKADKGDINLQYKLGNLYASAESILYNPYKAKIWFEEAAMGGHVLAQVEAGKLNAKALKFSEAIMFFKKARKNGNTEAKYLLGRIYFNGEGSVLPDYLKAYQLFKEAQNDDFNAACILDIGNSNSNMDRLEREKSIEMHKFIATETDDVQVQYTLGYVFEHGICIDKDYTEAAKYYDMAANLKSTDAQTCLGRLYKNGLGVQKNYYTAIKWFNSAIKSGSHEAMLEMGKMIYNGLGVSRDLERSSRYIRNAADLGNHKALYILGSSRYQEENHIKAVRYFTKSWREGGEVAAHFLDQYYDYPLIGNIYNQHLVNLYVKVAKHKNAETQYTLANIFLQGDIITQNYIQAFKYYRMAAKNEHGNSIDIVQFKNIRTNDSRIPKFIAMFTEVAKSKGEYADEAEFVLGNTYKDGKYVTLNIETAIEHYKRASSSNHTDAQYTLGYIYYNGVGGNVPDTDKAIGYYTRAANKGHDESQRHLLRFYSKKENDGTYPQNYIHWLTELAMKDQPERQTELGLLYQNDRITKPDFKNAIFWLDKAIKNNDLTGALTLAILYHSAKEHQNFNEAYRLYKTLINNDDSVKDIHIAHAMRNVGLLYEYGHGVVKNLEKAFSYYEKALNKRNIEANYNIGLLYYYGKGVSQNTTMALKYFQKMIKEFKKHPGSMCVFIDNHGEVLYRDSKEIAGVYSETFADTIMEMYPGIL